MNDNKLNLHRNNFTFRSNWQSEMPIYDITDTSLKDDMASMEHPLFALSKKPDLKIRHYEHNKNKIEIIPSVKGLATIYDKDILIYAISQLAADHNQGNKIKPQITIKIRNLLLFTNRHTGGYNYNLLEEALTRLSGTKIKTNIKTGGQEQINIFGLIESGTLIRNKLNNRTLELKIKLSEWIFNAINAKEILTLHRDYFSLRKPLERRIYEIARKHCGQQPEWKINLTLLKKKCGSKSPTKHFRYLIKNLIRHNHLPEYNMTTDNTDTIKFTKRKTLKKIKNTTKTTHSKLKNHYNSHNCISNWNVYSLEKKLKEHTIKNCHKTSYNSNKLFLDFHKKLSKKHIKHTKNNKT